MKDCERRIGRPRASVPRSTVCTWVPQPTHDALIRLAERKNQSVSALLRAAAVSLLEKAARAETAPQ